VAIRFGGNRHIDFRFLHAAPMAARPAGNVLPSQAQQIELLSTSGSESAYRIDARILTPPEQMPQLQNELHRALQRVLPDLQNGPL